MLNLKKENAKDQNTSALQPQRSENKVEVKKKNLIKITFFVLFELVFIAGSFFAGVNFPTKKQLSNLITNPVQNQATSSPIISPTISETNSLGKTTISFANDNDHGWIYIKSETTLIDPIVEYPNSGLRTITKTYTSNEDVSEPHELICLNQNDYKWTTLVTEPIDNSASDKSILVADRLFSFKRIPNTDNFLFVVEWNRAGGESNVRQWSTRKSERVLYMYDKDNAGHELKNIATYTAYPRIDSFSPEKRYVSLNLFGCWGCGSNKPPTLLLDTRSFTTKNIGRVSQFSWTSNGNYEYKDYVVIDCEYPQGWECTQDPNTLLLKTGKM